MYKKSASGNRELPCLVIFFRSIILIWKCQKCSLNRDTLVPEAAIYQTKCPFSVFRMLPYDSGLFPVRIMYFRHRYSINLLEFKWI